jgi:hypothetical protein
MRYHHPCENVALTANASFVSSCAPAGAKHHGGIVVAFVCVLGAHPRSFSRAPEDVVVLLSGPDSFVGRLRERRAIGNDLTYPFHFDDDHAGEPVGRFMCTKGKAQHVRSGVYALSVIHEYEGFDWNPPWDFTKGFLGTLGKDDAFRPLFTELAAQDDFVVANLQNHKDGARKLPPCTTQYDGVFLDGVYTPHSCYLRNVTFGDMPGCMQRIGGAVYAIGDSNMRRAMKAVMSNGNWCTLPALNGLPRVDCMCEDHNIIELDPSPFQGREFYGWVGAGVPYGNNSQVIIIGAGKMDDLIRERSQFFTYKIPPKVLIWGNIGAWPQGQLEISIGDGVTSFTAAMKELIKDLQKVLLKDPSITLIFRTAPFYCCTHSALRRYRQSSKRQRVMTDIKRRLLADAFPTALWWDTLAITAARPLDVIRDQATTCESNHPVADIVKADAKLFMHLICGL